MLLQAETQERTVSHAEPIVIGLVNNMPDAALRATERQFHALLSAASDNRAVRLKYFCLPGLARSETAQAHINSNYRDTGEMWNTHLDGLIVTGTEPRAPHLADEPYWEALAGLIDSVAEHRISTVWSCLAAHAAVLHHDGIERRRIDTRLTGVFDCVKIEGHPILDGLARWSTPHSRYNDLPEEALISRGYRVLSRSADAGVDLFIREREGLELFFQGHPEYQPDTLLVEYRRDVGRFLTGEKDGYPEMPRGYFDDRAAAALAAFERQARRNRDPALMSSFPFVTLEEKQSDRWREAAVRIYTNWISYLAEGAQRNNEEIRPLAG